MPKIPAPPANAGPHYDQDWQVVNSDLTYNYVPPVNVNDLQTYSQGWTDWGMAAQGLSQGGTLVLLSGNSICDEDQVDFGGQPAALAWPFPGHGYGDTLYAIAPAGTPGTTVPITITGPDVPGGGSYSAGTFTYLPEPTVTSVSPASGPYVPPAGSTLTIIGQNFGTYVYNNSGAIVGGNPTASMVAFTGNTLGAANPSTGQPPTVMEPVLTDTWNGGTNWTVTCDIPPGGYQGPGQMGGVDVQVETTPTGDLPPLQSATDVEGNWSPVTTTDAYGYYGTAVVTSVSPNTAPASPSSPYQMVTIKGLNLGGATGVEFGSQPAASFQDVYDVAAHPAYWLIMAMPPAGQAGTVGITVTTPGGSSVDPGAFTYVNPPVFNSLSPVQTWGAWGPLSGGTQITITGSYLGSVTAVNFGSVAGTNLSYNAATGQITVDSPAESAGAVDVSLLSPYATGGSLDTGVKFYYEGAPVVTRVSPNVVRRRG